LYIAELTKFQVAPKHLPLYCFKTLIQDFSKYSVEVACRGFLEPAGRYFYRRPETHAVMGQLLEMTKRKRQAIPLDPRLTVMLDNAYYQCNPPSSAAAAVRRRKPRTTMELYIRHLLYTRANKGEVETVFQLLRKLDWDDPLVLGTLYSSFTRIWKVQFGNIEVMAMLLSELMTYHPDLGAVVIDDLLEGIRLGLEQNLFKHNQRRLAQVKYLGELYLYHAIESHLIFDTLFTILGFGHADPHPHPSRAPSPFDLPHDHFRTRLCCLLLDTCG
ncbi:armadillo-type protein, partial [Dimargaris cristalligena]